MGLRDALRSLEPRFFLRFHDDTRHFNTRINITPERTAAALRGAFRERIRNRDEAAAEADARQRLRAGAAALTSHPDVRLLSRFPPLARRRMHAFALQHPRGRALLQVPGVPRHGARGTSYALLFFLSAISSRSSSRSCISPLLFLPSLSPFLSFFPPGAVAVSAARPGRHST